MTTLGAVALDDGTIRARLRWKLVNNEHEIQVDPWLSHHTLYLHHKITCERESQEDPWLNQHAF